jgi:hypothetical protein
MNLACSIQMATQLLVDIILTLVSMIRAMAPAHSLMLVYQTPEAAQQGRQS